MRSQVSDRDTPTVSEVRTILISDLPESKYKDDLCMLVHDPSTADVLVLAYTNSDGTWSAHIGWPEYRHIVDEEGGDRVVQYYCEVTRCKAGVWSDGTKVNRSFAEEVFKGWTGRVYR